MYAFLFYFDIEVGYLLVRKLTTVFYDGSLEALDSRVSHTPPHQMTWAKLRVSLRVRGVDLVRLQHKVDIITRTSTSFPYPYPHSAIDQPTCPPKTTSSKTPVTPNNYRLKKTLAVPLTNVQLQTTPSTEMCPLRKQPSRGATTLAADRR